MAGSSGLQIDEAAELLRALAHNTRLSLLMALKDGERSVGEIEQATGVSQPALSQQLGVLRKAGFIVPRRDAKQVFYQLSDDGLDRIVSFLGEARATSHPSTPKEGPVRLAGGGAAMFARILPRK